MIGNNNKKTVENSSLKKYLESGIFITHRERKLFPWIPRINIGITSLFRKLDRAIF